MTSTASGGPLHAAFLAALRESAYQGEIAEDEASRVVFSTDNSIYQMAPQAVLFPRSRGDLVEIARLAGESRFVDIRLTMRGGGTGTNGQSLNAGLVVDTSRHMNRILSIDPAKRRAWVEAGVVKDQLNRALKPYGLFFAPELSTSNRATIGGMVSTDACGQGSCLYGKTSNHVLALRSVLFGGTEWLSQPLSQGELEKLCQRPDKVGEIHRLADAIERKNRDLVDRIFPRLNRFLTGYDLKHLRTGDGGFNLNALLCGSEGTLALLAEVELNLLPLPRASMLINVRYDDFLSALKDARLLTSLGVASVETIDGKLLALARADAVWPGIAAFFPDDAAGPAEGVNIVELLAEDETELALRLATVEQVLAENPTTARRGYTRTGEEKEIEAIWSMRKRAVGLLGAVEGARRPLPFVEDTAVPPENLADYIAEFRALLDSEELSYGMFGHVDAGVLHVRPALDLSDPEQVPLIRRISDAVFALTRKYGGVFWGEHGKGVRSEYAPEMFGPLYPVMQEIKVAFDPRGQLNPGKIATPGIGALARIDAFPLRGEFDRQITREVRGSFGQAMACNGNGACFDFDRDSPMCPSFKGTGDRRFSPKGRASLLREWLRRLGQEGRDPLKEVEQFRRQPVWKGLANRAFNSLFSAGNDAFSQEVKTVMETCLACKACSSQCPVKVDVPAFRARFLEHYYGRYLRPFKDPMVASIEVMLPIMAKVGWAYNTLVTSRAGRFVMARLGLTALPQLSRLPLKRGLKDAVIGIAQPEILAALSPDEKARSVILVQDSFTTFFEAELLLDIGIVLKELGFSPYFAPLKPHGKPLHVHGYLAAFARRAEANARHLKRLEQSGIALVGIDPSMTLAYRQEYPAALGSEHVPTVLLLQEWLGARLDLIRDPGISSEQRFRLLPHCTERTAAAATMSQWGMIFQRLGLDLEVSAAGCCGMAGTFGHETRNRPLSETIYRQSWGG